MKYQKTDNGVDIPVGKAPVIYYQDLEEIYNPNRHPKVENLMAVVGKEFLPKKGLDATISLRPEALLLKEKLNLDSSQDPNIPLSSYRDQSQRSGLDIASLALSVGVYANSISQNPSAQNKVVHLEAEPEDNYELSQQSQSRIDESRDQSESFSSHFRTESKLDSMGLTPQESVHFEMNKEQQKSKDTVAPPATQKLPERLSLDVDASGKDKAPPSQERPLSSDALLSGAKPFRK